MIFKGRRKIISSYTQNDLLDINNVLTMINTTMAIHQLNKHEIEYLINYRNGDQPILHKCKPIRDEINNKLVINYAQMITRTIIGYFLGTPIQYIQSGAQKKTQIDKLNKFVQYEDKASVDQEIAEYQSICGVGYRVIYTDGQLADEVPFEEKSLNPAVTYVVYENDIAEKPLCGITYHVLVNNKNSQIGYKFYIYTENGKYEIETKSNFRVTSIDKVIYEPYNVGGVPIIEYPNNIWRIGDWELCIGLMNSISEIYSDRLDDIDQIIQSLLVFINTDINADQYDEMRKKGVVMLKSLNGIGGSNSDIKSVQSQLDQTGVNLFSQELDTKLYALIGIPDRDNNSGGGSDTGAAVELRNGYPDLETLARNKELIFKKSEKQSLRIILNILNNKLNFNLSLLDVDIKFSRNKNNNLLVKTQSLGTLLSSKIVSPSDALTIVDLVSDVNEFVSRGEAFWQDEFAGKAPETTEDTPETNTDTSDVTKENDKNKTSIDKTSSNE